MNKPVVIMYIRDSGLLITKDGKDWESFLSDPDWVTVAMCMKYLRSLGIREYTIKDEQSPLRATERSTQ